MQGKTRKKFTISFECLVANSFVLMALLLMLAGCAEERPGYYGAYPSDNTYYPRSHTTVIVTDDDNGRAYDENSDSDRHNYDNQWDYGLASNADCHGTSNNGIAAVC